MPNETATMIIELLKVATIQPAQDAKPPIYMVILQLNLRIKNVAAGPANHKWDNYRGVAKCNGFSQLNIEIIINF